MGLPETFISAFGVFLVISPNRVPLPAANIIAFHPVRGSPAEVLRTRDLVASETSNGIHLFKKGTTNTPFRRSPGSPQIPPSSKNIGYSIIEK